MRTGISAWIFALGMVILFIASWPGYAGANPGSSTLTVFQRVEQAYRRGEIDYETALLNKVYAVFAPQKLPTRFQVLYPQVMKSATPLFLEINKNWPRLSERTRRELLPFLQRPTEGSEGSPGHSYTASATSYQRPGGHFKIWYVTETEDAPSLEDADGDGVPDYVNRCAQIFEEVWRVEVDSLGYQKPVEDGNWYPQNEDYGEDSKYDIYIEDLPAGPNLYLFGYTQREYSPGGRRFSSYIVVDNDYSWYPQLYPGKEAIDALRVTAAHEFFHAIQFAYDALEDVYWMEISSTWMEDVVYDDVNDYYNFLPDFFDSTEKSLDTLDGQHEYASCIWAHFLAQKYGLNIIRQIWQQCENANSFAAFDTVLGDRGTGFYGAFQEFTRWNYYTGRRADPTRYYEEGADYPEVEFHGVHSSYPDSGRGWVDHLGSAYIQFETGRSPGGMNLSFDGPNGSIWAGNAIADREYGADDSLGFSVNPSGHGELEVREWSRYSDVVLIPAVLATSGAGYGFTYRAEYDSTLGDLPPVSQTTLLQNRPNPFRISEYPYITLLPFYLSQEAEVKIRVFTVAGEVVRTIHLGHLDPGYYDENYQTYGNYWDGRNDRGELVANGVYLYQLVAGDFVQTRKLVVIR